MRRAKANLYCSYVCHQNAVIAIKIIGIYTPLFYKKNIYRENIEAQICENLKIF